MNKHDLGTREYRTLAEISTWSRGYSQTWAPKTCEKLCAKGLIAPGPDRTWKITEAGIQVLKPE